MTQPESRTGRNELRRSGSSGERRANVRKRHPNCRRVKIHRSYTVEDIASLLEVHKNTVRQWIKAGLPTIDDRRPKLILGRQLIAFLQARRASKKRGCHSGEIFCVRCRAPKFPAAGIAEYRPINEKIGNLAAICPDCHSMIYRCVSIMRLGEVRGEMDITFPQALQHLREISEPTVNSDLKGDIEQ